MKCLQCQQGVNTLHASGKCRPCRQTKCLSCGKNFAREQRAKFSNLCSKCQTNKDRLAKNRNAVIHMDV